MAVDALSGVVLCRAGPHRLAFLAGQVTHVASDDLPHRPARRAFALPAIEGKVLQGLDDAAVSVDSLEITQDPLRLLPTPALLAAKVGGSLIGFVSTGDALWPVLRLREFWIYLGEGVLRG